MNAAVVLGAVLTAAAAAALTSWMRAIAGSDSPWLRTPAHVVLAALGGAGAAALADSPLETIAFATLALSCALLVVVDLSAHRIPDALVGRTYPVFLGLLALTSLVDGDWSAFLRALTAAVAVTALYFVLALIAPSGMGLGDVKLSGLLGAFLGWLGWAEVVMGTLAAFVLGGTFALVLVVTLRARGDTAFAFGPWMVAGAVVGAAWGPRLMGA